MKILYEMKRHLKYLTLISHLRRSRQDIEECFSAIEIGDLKNLEHLTHDGNIFHRTEKVYYAPLNKCLTSGKYGLTCYGKINSVTTTLRRGVWGEFGNYLGLFGKWIQFPPIKVPEKDLESLKQERKLVISILHNYKLVGWAIQNRLLGKESTKEPTQHELEYYISHLYEGMKNLHQFHRGGKSRPFLMGSPKRPSQGLSNIHRNMFYWEVNQWLNPNILKPLLRERR